MQKANIYTVQEMREDPGKLVIVSLAASKLFPQMEEVAALPLQQLQLAYRTAHPDSLYVQNHLFFYILQKRQIAAGILQENVITENIEEGLMPGDIEEQMKALDIE